VKKQNATVNDVNNGAQHSGEYVGRGAAGRPVLQYATSHTAFPLVWDDKMSSIV
jgi:hypothetical protein